LFWDDAGRENSDRTPALLPVKVGVQQTLASDPDAERWVETARDVKLA
jgi:hypothetical protein